VVGGVFLIAGGPGLLRAANDPQARLRVRAGLRYGVLTGIFIASYTVVDGYAVKAMLLSPVLVDYMGNFVRGFVRASVAKELSRVPSCLASQRAACSGLWKPPFQMPERRCWATQPRLRY
jgi:hypothetical protein